MCCQKKNAQTPQKWIGIAAITAYRWTLSPVFYAFGVRCRHEPSCSLYAMDAIMAQGLWRGSWLALGRIGRCRPGGTHGYDPAPLTRTGVPWWKIWAFRGTDGPAIE
ncbi:membrane protein insertion efficiency factor YidD [Glycocaulis alkaliphilus]|uniref:membrane protein insertion efficiency factor YidD n=1 Tax=Glycocaulis alkaliphilus TaxID=1434191 RepID=UPI000FD82AA9|nr:membrane protein insertion efficiency factor YidD [Glycocaulis alkaliphilus]